MNIFCELFGHKPPSYGRKIGSDYMKLYRRGADGIGREHAALYCDCPRCGENYYVGATHLPEAEVRHER